MSKINQREVLQRNINQIMESGLAPIAQNQALAETGESFMLNEPCTDPKTFHHGLDTIRRAQKILHVIISN